MTAYTGIRPSASFSNVARDSAAYLV